MSDRYTLAVHEAGHAVSGYHGGYEPRVKLITIDPSIDPHFQGFVLHHRYFGDNSFPRSSSAIFAEAYSRLGGLAAEEVLLGHQVFGDPAFAGDWNFARCAMQEELLKDRNIPSYSRMFYKAARQYCPGSYTERLLRQLWIKADGKQLDDGDFYLQTESLLERVHDKTKEIVSHSRQDVEKLADALMERETIVGNEMYDLMGWQPKF